MFGLTTKAKYNELKSKVDEQSTKLKDLETSLNQAQQVSRELRLSLPVSDYVVTFVSGNKEVVLAQDCDRMGDWFYFISKGDIVAQFSSGQIACIIKRVVINKK